MVKPMFGWAPSTQSDELLREAFVKGALESAAAVEACDATRAVQAFQFGAAIRREIRSRDTAEEILDPLLSHPAPSVRLWAAADLLCTDSERAAAVLERMSSAGGLVGTDARLTLTVWRGGELTPP